MLAREDDTGQSPRPAWRGGRPRRPRLDTLHPVRRPGPVQLGRELRRQLRPDELGARARPDAAGQEWHREYGSGAPRGPEESPCAWLPRTGRSDPRPGGEAGPPSLPPPPSYVLYVIRAWACWGAPLPGAREPSQQIRVRTQEPAGPPPAALDPICLMVSRWGQVHGGRSAREAPAHPTAPRGVRPAMTGGGSPTC